MLPPIKEELPNLKLKKHNYTPLRIFLTVNVVALLVILGLTMLLKRGEVPQKTNLRAVAPSGRGSNLGMEIFLMPEKQFSDTRTLAGEMDKLISIVGGVILKRDEGSSGRLEWVRMLIPRSNLDEFWEQISSLGDIRTNYNENMPQEGLNWDSSVVLKTPSQNTGSTKVLSSIPIYLSIIYPLSQE